MVPCPNFPSKFVNDVKNSNFSSTILSSNGQIDPEWEKFFEACYNVKVKDSDINRDAKDELKNEIKKGNLPARKYTSEINAIIKAYNNYIPKERQKRKQAFDADKVKFFEENASQEPLDSKNKPKGKNWSTIKKELEKDWILSQDISVYKTEYQDLLKKYNYNIKEKSLFKALHRNNITAQTDVDDFIDNNFKGKTESFQKQGIYGRFLDYQDTIRTDFNNSLQQSPLPREIQKLFEDLSELNIRGKLKNSDIGKKLQQDYFVTDPRVAQKVERDFIAYYGGGARFLPSSEEAAFESLPYGIKDEKSLAREIIRKKGPHKFQDEYLKRLYKRYKEKTEKWKKKRDKFNNKLNKENAKFEGWIRGNFDRARVSSLLKSDHGFRYQKERDKLLTKGFDAYLASRTTFDEDKLINDLLNDYSGHLLKGQKFIVAATSRGMPQNTPQAQINAFYNKYRRAQKNYAVGTKTGTTPFLIEQQRRAAAKNLDLINPKQLTRADHRKFAKPFWAAHLLPQPNKDKWGYSSLPEDFTDIILSQPVLGEAPAVELESEQNRRTTQGALETLYAFRRHASDEYAKEILKRYGVNAKDPWFKDVTKAMKIKSTKEEKKYFTAMYRLQDFLGQDDETLMRQRVELEAQGKAPKIYDDPASLLDKFNPLSSYNIQGREYENRKTKLTRKLSSKNQKYLDQLNQGASETQLEPLRKTIDSLAHELADLEEAIKKHKEGYRRTDTLEDKIGREKSNAKELLDELQRVIDPKTGHIRRGAKPSEALMEFTNVHSDEQAAAVVAKDKDFKAENKWAEIRDKRRKERQERIERKSEEWGEKGRNVGELVGSLVRVEGGVYSTALQSLGLSLRKKGYTKAGKAFQAAGNFTNNASVKMASSAVSAGFKLGSLLGKLAGGVGIAIAAFSGLVSAFKKGYEAIEKQTAKMLSYAKFDSGLAVANLKSKGRQYYRDINYARGVSKTGVQLIAERERMQDNLTPFRTAIDNAKNVFFTYLAKGFNKVLEALKPLLPVVRALGRATSAFAKIAGKVGKFVLKAFLNFTSIGLALKSAYSFLVKIGNMLRAVEENKENKENKAKQTLKDGRVKSKEELKELRDTEEYKRLFEKEKGQATKRIIKEKIKRGVAPQYASKTFRSEIEDEIFNGKNKAARDLAFYSQKYLDNYYKGGKNLSQKESFSIENSLTKYMSEKEKKEFTSRQNDADFQNEYNLSLKAFSDYYTSMIDPKAFNASEISKEYQAFGKDIDNVSDLREIIMNSTIIADVLKEQIKLTEEGNKERRKITHNTAPKDDKSGDIILDALSSIGSRYSAPNYTAGFKKAEEVERSKQYGRFAEATVTQWGRNRK